VRETVLTSNPWLVPVTALRRQPGTRRQEVRAGRIGELSVAGSVVPAGVEAVAVAVLDSILGGIEVAADIRAPWEGECRRCLRPLSGELHCEVRELYRARQSDAGRPSAAPTGPGKSDRHGGHGGQDRHGGLDGQGTQGGHADHGGRGRHGGHGGDGGHANREADLDEDTYPLEGDQLDLRPLVRDALLLELPLAPLCQPDCLGLCPRCGADLNTGPCSCVPDRDPRWGALDVLQGAGDEEGRAT
jgi:uncharacterized protein